MDDDMEGGPLYNLPRMQTTVVGNQSRASRPAAPRIPLARIVVLAIAIVVMATVIRVVASIGLESYQTGPFRFDAPADWALREARAGYTGGSSHAVLGTVPIPSSCGEGNVDINCYLAQRLPASTVSIVLTTSSPFRRIDEPVVPPQGIRTEIGGFEAYRVDHEIAPNDYYGSTFAVSWTVLQPGNPGTFWVINARVRGPGADRLLHDVERVVASMRIAPQPWP